MSETSEPANADIERTQNKEPQNKPSLARWYRTTSLFCVCLFFLYIRRSRVVRGISLSQCRFFHPIAVECSQWDRQRLPIQTSISRIEVGGGRAQARPYHKKAGIEAGGGRAQARPYHKKAGIEVGGGRAQARPYHNEYSPHKSCYGEHVAVAQVVTRHGRLFVYYRQNCHTVGSSGCEQITCAPLRRRSCRPGE
jgi:hypothetical protein